MTQMDTFEASLADLQPSQLYICDDKLDKVEQAMRGTSGDVIDPVPVKRMGSRRVLTDGHTRAVAALRQSRKTILACWEDEDLDWEAYEICVDWCLAEGIHSVADLAPRIVSANEYKKLWYKRCQALHRRLAEQRAGIHPKSG